jgi:hypothetical protein
MPKVRERFAAISRELSIGRGGRLWSHPLPLEPPFAPFDPLRLNNVQNQPPRSCPVVDAPKELQFLRVHPSHEDHYSLALAEQLPLSLHPSYPVAWEVLGIEGRVRLQVTATPQDLSAAVSQVQAHYPNCEVFQTEDLLPEMVAQLRCARGYRLRRSHLFMLREGHRTEPYAALVGLLGALRSEEAALFQGLFIPARLGWRSNILKLARDPFEPGKSAYFDMPQLPKRAETKVARLLFAVALRLAASNKDLLDRLEGSFLSQFQGEENSLTPMEGPYPTGAIMSRTTHATGMLLNLGERLRWCTFLTLDQCLRHWQPLSPALLLQS